MNNSENIENKITITNDDYGLNTGFSSLQDAEWLITDYDLMELEVLKKELKHLEYHNNTYDDKNLNQLPF